MMKDIAPPPRPGGVSKARKLRREMSLPEVLLWQTLKNRPHGLKFRKQDPTGNYILDFYCGDARLAIEVDGEAHSRGTRPARDAFRDTWLAYHGVATLRIPAIEVLKNLEGVLTVICDTARSRLPHHHPAAPGGPPPRDKLGEE